MDSVVPHLCNFSVGYGINSLNFATEVQHEPSPVRRAVTNGVTSTGSVSAKNFKGCFGLFMPNCMKLVGKFNNLFTWGLKEVT